MDTPNHKKKSEGYSKPHLEKLWTENFEFIVAQAKAGKGAHFLSKHFNIEENYTTLSYSSIYFFSQGYPCAESLVIPKGLFN